MASPTLVVEPWDVPAQRQAVAVLRGAVERSEVSHAWALVGPADVGQEAATRWLAAALNCGAMLPPCGGCDICRRCLRGAYPALREFAPTGAMYRVDEVREQWLRTAFHTPSEGTWKVLRIAHADRMNEAAANAFLKGLEEPPPRTVWVLEVTDPDELPDTILSRCRVVRFSGWGADELDAEARRLGLDDATERALAVRAAMGSPRALRRLALPQGRDDLRAHRSIPSRLRDEGPAFALTAARALDDEVKRRTAALRAEGRAEIETVAERSGDELPRGVAKQMTERLARREREVRVVTLHAALDDLLGWLRDCLLVGAGGDPAAAVNADAAELLRRDAEALGPRRLLRACDLVLATRDDLELNVGQGLALEALLLQLSALMLDQTAETPSG